MVAGGPVKIAVLTLGTRGDVQPYVALSKALAARGHDVLLAAPDNFDSWIESHGLAFHPIGIDMHAFLQLPEVRRVMSGHWLALAKLWRKVEFPCRLAAFFRLFQRAPGGLGQITDGFLLVHSP